MQIVTTHKNMDFDALASTVAATILYPEAIAVVPKSANPNVKAFLSIHKDFFDVSTFDDIDTGAVERLIIVDINSWGRLGRHPAELEMPGENGGKYYPHDSTVKIGK